MNRRSFSKILAGAALGCAADLSFSAQAQPASKTSDTDRPFRSVNVPEDGRRVIFFFDFACPYCARYHEPLMNWASTVPQGVQTMFVPVVNMADVARRRDQIIAAKCFYSAFQVATKEQMGRFLGSVYEQYQSTHSLASKPMWAKAVKAAGIDLRAFTTELSSDRSDFQIQYAARKAVQYALRATPSVAVGGKYVLTPEDVLGDEAMFFNILNGLTSEIL